MEEKQFKKEVKALQEQMKQFLLGSRLNINGVKISPMEIEAYYYEKGKFEDDSVHQNELQQNNKGHFYIHRNKKKKTDPYKGRNYPGIDFVLSDKEEIYYSFLIRSAVIDGTLVTGPNNVLRNIMSASQLKMEEIESCKVTVEPYNSVGIVFFSSRVGLGKGVSSPYREARLRAVVWDDQHFKKTRYKKKEELMKDFIERHDLTKDESIDFAQKYFDYVPSWVK